VSELNRTAELRPGPVVVSEAEPRRSKWNKARVAFWVLTVLGGAAGAVMVSPWRHPLQGLVFGALLGAVAGMVVSAVMTVWPVLRSLWHWTVELALAAGLVLGGTALVSALGVWSTVALVAVVSGGTAVLGPVRRRVLGLVWCAVTRHRLRVCFAAFIRARNRLDPGLGPLILTARPTPAGERVWVWLRTGLDVAELESRTGKMAVACWASDVQVSPSRRFAALVRIDVTRRDPLTVVLTSPLVRQLPGSQPAPIAAEPVDLSRLALDLADVPEESVTPVEPARRPRPAAVKPVPVIESDAAA
jgi:hypothetical protein